MNSFQERVNAKIPADRMPGTAIGKMIRAMAPKRVAPSTRAHSSSSFGMDVAPGPVELRVGPDRGDEHPVERKERPDEEQGQRDVEEDPLLPAPLDDHYAPSRRRR